jgi:poly-beta-1,6-N-acetyl-D-glucosamine synthase
VDVAPRVLIVTPVRNEAAHLERVACSLAAQTRPPDCWVVVDDGSSDRTPDILHALARDLPFLRAVATPPDFTIDRGDRLAVAAAPRAFNFGLRAVAWGQFTHVGKLDGDTELPPDYFERLLAEFQRDSQLGIGGGVRMESARRGWRMERIPGSHVPGGLKLYTKECFDAIGGMHERLGWDTIDEVYARMRGFTTRSFPELKARHHRPIGTADGTLRGRARHGECAYVARFSLWWILLRSFKVALARPRGLSGVAFVYGYVRAGARSAPRVEDAAFRRFVRRDLRRRMVAPLRLGAG